MDRFNFIIKTLFASSVVIMILEAFLPSDKFRTYLKMFSGAVLVLTVVRMLSTVSLPDIAEILPKVKNDVSFSENAAFSKELKRFSMEKLKKLAENTCISVLKRECCVRIYEEANNHCRLYISSSVAFTEDEKASVSDIIHESCGLEKENIIFFVSNER